MSEEHQYDFDEEEVTTEETTTEETEVETEEQEEQPKEEAKEEQEEAKEVDTYLDFERPETITPERVKARIDAETRRKYEQERELRQLREAREKLEKELHELKKPKEVQPPSTDLAYEDAEEFRRQNEAYVAAERARAEWELRQQEIERKAAEALESEKQKKVSQLVERAEKAGITQDSLEVSSQIIATVLQQSARNDQDAARHGEVMRFVIEHDYGAQLLTDLAKNPTELQEIANLSATQAAVRLNEKARTYQKSLKSKTPPPDEPLRGNGAPPQKVGPQGATYE